MFLTQLLKEVKRVNEIDEPEVILDRYSVSETSDGSGIGVTGSEVESEDTVEGGSEIYSESSNSTLDSQASNDSRSTRKLRDRKVKVNYK